jgi:hypothetical protein
MVAWFWERMDRLRAETVDNDPTTLKVSKSLIGNVIVKRCRDRRERLHRPGLSTHGDQRN